MYFLITKCIKCIFKGYLNTQNNYHILLKSSECLVTLLKIILYSLGYFILPYPQVGILFGFLCCSLCLF